jgi:hypothetical protein
VDRDLTSWNKLVLIALVSFVYAFVLNPIATNGCVNPRIYLNPTFVPRRNMSETNPHRVSIYEEVIGPMIGCDVKRVEEEYGGFIDNREPNNPNLVAAKKKCRDEFLAVAFFEHADKRRYSDLQTSLSNDYLRKRLMSIPTLWYMPRKS